MFSSILDEACNGFQLSTARSVWNSRINLWTQIATRVDASLCGTRISVNCKLGKNLKTVAEWRNRETTAHRKTWSKNRSPPFSARIGTPR